MKIPFRKVCGLGLPKHGKSHPHAVERSFTQLDKLSQASQDMHNMRGCYDRLCSAAASTMKTAYEFSDSLRKTADCLLEITALSDDGDIGKVLLMLGKAQSKIQELNYNYRSHINETISASSKSLLNELLIVEEMKLKCDKTWTAYEALKNNKDHVSTKKLQTARDKFDENANLFISRMKSLKRGQSRSLLTQASRHYAAQMRFFRKALKTLESIEPIVKSTTALHHIDYCLIMLDKNEDRDSSFLTDELNIDAHMNAKKNELSLKENMYKRPFQNTTKVGINLNTETKSTPISMDPTFDPSESNHKMRRSSTRKPNTYVLPTPLEKSSVTSGIESQHGQPTNMWNSKPMDNKKYTFSSHIGSKTHRLPIPTFTRSFSTPQVSPSLGFLLPTISDLHELPRPPAKKKSLKVGFSVPF